MLSSSKPPEWTSVFSQNYSVIPHPTTTQKTLLSTAILPRLSSLSGIKYPYQIILTDIQSLPIPHALILDPTLYCCIRISLFDLDLRCFFGKTWTSNPVWSRSSHDPDSNIKDAHIETSRLSAKLSNLVPIFFNNSAHTSIHIFAAKILLRL